MKIDRKLEVFDSLIDYVCEHCNSELEEYHTYREIIGLSKEEIEDLGFAFGKEIDEMEEEMNEEYGNGGEFRG